MSPVSHREGMPIHNQLRVLRAERGLSRVALAKLVEVHPQTIGAIERGDYFPSLDLAFRFSDVFELPIEAIFSRKPFVPLSAQLYNKEERS